VLIQGFTPDDIGKVGGGNFCRVFGKVTASHAESQFDREREPLEETSRLHTQFGPGTSSIERRGARFDNSSIKRRLELV
jgi:hypothetical protein